jgi:hypothetical protein
MYVHSCEDAVSNSEDILTKVCADSVTDVSMAGSIKYQRIMVG